MLVPALYYGGISSCTAAAAAGIMFHMRASARPVTGRDIVPRSVRSYHMMCYVQQYRVLH